MIPGAIKRDRGRGGRRRGGSYVFFLKNATVYIPLNTMWMKFRSGVSLTGYSSSFSATGGAGGGERRSRACPVSN